jgi:hypothetical protein
VLGLCVLVSLTLWMPQVWQRMGKRFNRKFAGASKTDERRSYRQETALSSSSTPNNNGMYSKTTIQEGNLSRSHDMDASALDQKLSGLHVKDIMADTASSLAPLHNAQPSNTTSPSSSHSDDEPKHTTQTDNTEHHEATDGIRNASNAKPMDHAATNSIDTSPSKSTPTPSPVHQKKSRRRSSAGNSSTTTTQGMPKGDAKGSQRPSESQSHGSESVRRPDDDITSNVNNTSTQQKESSSSSLSSDTPQQHDLTNPPQQLSESPEIASCGRPVNLSQFQGLPPERWHEYLHAIDQAVSPRCDFFAYPRSNGTLVMTYR